MEHCSSWETSSHSAAKKFSTFFMEPKGSLLCLQEPATCSHPEWDASSTQLPTWFI